MSREEEPAASKLLEAPAGAGRLDAFLARELPELSRTRLQALIREGDVRVGGKAARPSLRLRGGERIELTLPASDLSDLAPEALAFGVLYEDEDIVVVDKPAGLVVHPARGHRGGTLVNGLLHRIPSLAREGGFERPGIVHRIDKGTTGVLVVACHDLALRRLQAQFMVHTVDRRYLAVVHGVPSTTSGRVQSLLGRHPRERLRFASVSEGGRRAVTHWRLLHSVEAFSLVECRLETGRTHQVRVHLSELGHHVVGDLLYGRRGPPAALTDLWPTHTLLHAESLAFDHPIDGRRLAFAAPPPEDLRAFCERVGLDLSRTLRSSR
jgi:23S rRNA pseudouridine1911/1915/1917 synthase